MQAPAAVTATTLVRPFGTVLPTVRGPKGLWGALVLMVMDDAPAMAVDAVIDLGDGDAHLDYLARVSGRPPAAS